MRDYHRKNVSPNGENDDIATNISDTIAAITPTTKMPESKQPKHLDKLMKDSGNGKDLITGCWNIRRGLLKREHEIKDMLTSQKLDILFLVETDTNAILEEKDYKLTGYQTVFALKNK